MNYHYPSEASFGYTNLRSTTGQAPGYLHPIAYATARFVASANKYLDVSGTKIVSKYLVTELKKDKASIETIDQVMKYVDWVCTEYAYGDYGAIRACIIAAEFSEDMSDYLEKYGKRQYMLGSHPAVNKSWSDIILLKYEYSGGKIIYKMANPYEKLIP